MIALAVTAHDKQLILDLVALAAPPVEVIDPLGEALPLRLIALGVKRDVSRISPVEEAKVLRRLRSASARANCNKLTATRQNSHSQTHWGQSSGRLVGNIPSR